MKLLNEQTYYYLRDLIKNNELSYQKIYSETKLSKELGVSRTPFRDAIHRLESEGYIDILPSKGFMLHRMTRKDIIETLQIRSALECYCTLQIAKNHTSEKAEKLFLDLKFTLDKLKEVLNSKKSLDEFCKYDFMFHTLIIEYMDNQQISSVFAKYLYRMNKLASSSLTHDGRMAATYLEHMEIFNAMKNGDIDHVYQITLKHMENPIKINLSYF